ncbi:MAG: LacI family transcriptional regulator [Mesorhizobium amorphae]|nr:MAG: LacI family transcriptional regulator [Mesorhizobium amorphae]
MAKGTVTSGDVARHAKVSQSAVSRTFNPGASVSDETRARVLASAQALGYRPNALARAMISGRSQLVAVLVAYLDDPFYALVLEGMSRALQEKGFHVLLFMTDPGTQDAVVEQILQYQVDAIVMVSATLSSDLAQRCADTGIPVVQFNRYAASSPASSVTSDNVAGGRMAAHFLADNGHKRIAFVAGWEDASTSRDREAGFYTGLAERGLAVWARGVGLFTPEGAAAATRKLFGGALKPDAVFVVSDHMAFAVIDTLRNELSLRVPEDVSVVGYDDVPPAASGAYALTTVEQPVLRMVEMTVATLMDQLESGEIQKRATVLPARLVVRGSARLL